MSFETKRVEKRTNALIDRRAWRKRKPVEQIMATRNPGGVKRAKDSAWPIFPCGLFTVTIISLVSNDV